jgi:hypothetical protein
MAMFEDRGYCPANAFVRENAVSQLWDTTRTILGDRISYMVYDHGQNCFKGAYIVDALKGATGTLGVEVATLLSCLIPECRYSEVGKPIVCHDLLNPFQIPSYMLTGYEVTAKANSKDTRMIEDERYLVAIRSTEEEVHVYLYQK